MLGNSKYSNLNMSDHNMRYFIIFFIELYCNQKIY